MRAPAALVPVKRLDLAKTRLATTLDPAERAEVAERLFTHVLAELAATARFSLVAVVTADATVGERARALGAVVLPDPPGAGSLGGVVDAALDALAARGETSAVVVMADLPLLDAAAVGRFLDSTRAGEVLLAPDRDGSGTNLLYLPLPRRFATRFAEPGSGGLHAGAAADAGLAVGHHADAALAFDLDLAADLQSLPPALRPRRPER